MGSNIADHDVLGSLLRASGLDPEEGLASLTRGLFKGAVDQDWDKSRRLGITAVPTFVFGGHGLVGAQPYERLKHLVLNGMPNP